MTEKEPGQRRGDSVGARRSPLEGALVRLRAREPEDEPQYHAWLNDPEVTEHLALRYPVSHLFERDFLQMDKGPSYGRAAFAVETLADGKLIGSTSLNAASPENRSAELGIFVGDKAYWDRGYGTDIVRTICRFGFEMMNLHRIQLEVFAPNARARSVYEKVGFREEACRRGGRFENGRYLDVVVMGLIEGELR